MTDTETSPPASDTSTLFWCAVLLVATAVIFGGASQFNPWRLAVVELAALPLAFFALRRFQLRPGQALALAILAGLFAIPLLQLTPLPPALWTKLPGGGARLQALTLAGLPAGWRSASLAPEQTLGCVLALAPPAAMFLAGLRLRASDLRGLAVLWIGLAAVGLVVGAGQLAGGAASPFYLYRVTNSDSLVGFFANRNHEAASLLALTPFAAHLALRPSRRGRKFGRELGAVFVFLAVVALGVVRSRTGIVLASPVLACALSVGWRGGGGKADWRVIAGLAGAGLAAAAAVSLFSLTPILDRFAADAPLEQRFQTWPVIAAAAPDYQPTGAGIGSFPRIYASVEPLGLVGPTFLNHAHNEYLELWLEAGWLGAGLFGVFGVWFASANWRAWRLADSRAGLALAAGVAILSMLAVSAVDYPLRTESLAVFAAFCCACLARR